MLIKIRSRRHNEFAVNKSDNNIGFDYHVLHIMKPLCRIEEDVPKGKTINYNFVGVRLGLDDHFIC